MIISIIAAVASNRVIGVSNRLPWHLPSDLRHFKRLTMGHHLVMGRKTFSSLAGPLPGRTIVVITRNPSFSPVGVHTAHSLSDALELTKNDSEIFIAGGAEIYAEALPVADRMYLTRIHQEFAGDTWFPDFDEDAWKITEQSDYPSDRENSYPYSFLTYERIR